MKDSLVITNESHLYNFLKIKVSKQMFEANKLTRGRSHHSVLYFCTWCCVYILLFAFI